MKKMMSAKRNVLVLAFAVIVVVAGAAVTQAIGSRFWDDNGNGVGDNCDLYNAMTSLTDETISPICDASGNQSNGLGLWSGQTIPVHMEMDGNGLSVPVVRAKAYFRNIPRLAGSVPARPDLSGVAWGAAVIAIKSPDLCPNTGINGNHALDGFGLGWYGTGGGGDASNIAGDDVTRFAIGDVVRWGQVRYNNTNCQSEITVDLKSINPARINPVEGIANYWHVDIDVRHWDLSARHDSIAGNYDSRCQGFSSETRCDGVINGFYIQEQGSNAGYHSVVTSSGTRRQSGFDPYDGFVATTKRAPDSKPGGYPAYDNSLYYSALMRFGAGCDAGVYDEDLSGSAGTPPTTAQVNTAPRFSITFFDIDYYAGAPELRKIHVRLLDTTNGKWLWGGTNIYQGDDPPVDAGNIVRNNGVWRNDRPNLGQSLTVPHTDKAYFVLTFPAINNHRYILQLVNIQGGLVNQLGVPFNGVYYQRDCNLTAGARLVLDPGESSHVEVGSDATARAYIDNTGVADANLQYLHRIWYERAGLEAGNPADKAYNTAVDASVSAPHRGDQLVGSAGWTNITVGAGQSPLVSTLSATNVTLVPGMTHICSSIEVRKQDPNGPTRIIPRYDAKCTPIAKAPGFSVEKADVRAGGRLLAGGAASCTLNVPAFSINDAFAPIRGHLYTGAKSSIVEYALMTPGRISNVKRTFTSNSDLRFGTTTWAAPDGRFLGNLAQANAPTHCTPNVSGLYGQFATPKTSAPPANVTTSGEYVLDNAGDETLTVCSGGCTVGPGGRIVIRASKPAAAVGIKKVRVAGNILFSGSPYASIDTIPQFVLIADDGIELEFAASVTEVNGIFAAGDKVRTCDQREGGAVAMNASDCASALLTRALLITDGRVYPFRTAGFGSVADASFAEVFRVAPSSVLSDYARAKDEPIVTTRYLTELPPRF